MAREIVAFDDYRSGATGKALAEFRAISDDGDAPPAVKRRSQAMATYLAAGGDENFGTVPPPPQVKAPAAPQTAPAQGPKPQ